MAERWRAVVGWEGLYEVSDLGRVRSVDRIVAFADGRTRSYAGRMLKLKPQNQYGYPMAPLSRGQQHKYWRTVHTLVMDAFVGPCPIGSEVCHRKNNRSPALTNLRYDTRINNFKDKHTDGTQLTGPKHPWTRYEKPFLELIKSATGTLSEISARFGVSRAYVWNIRNGKRRVFD